MAAVPLKKRHQLEIGDKSQECSDKEMDGADSDSAPSFGSDLYRDDDDKAQLEKMSELEREMILAERSTCWDDYRLKKMMKARAKHGKWPKGGSSSSRGVRMKRSRSPPPPVTDVRASAGRTSLRGIENSVATRSPLEELRARRMRQHDSEGYRNRLRHLFGDGFSNCDRSVFVI